MRATIGWGIAVVAGLVPAWAWAQDADGDGVPDGSDNCPTVANADQASSNAFGFGDACLAPDATVDPAAVLEPGAVIRAGAVVGAATVRAGCVVGAAARLDAGATCGLGADLAPKAAVGVGSGIGADAALGRRTQVGAGSSVGAEALLARAVWIGDGATIGAEAVLGYGAWVGDGASVGDRARVGNLGRIEANAQLGADASLGRDSVIGAGTVVAAFAQIGPDVQIGGSGSVGDSARVRRGCRLGDDVTVGARARLGRDCAVADYADIGEDAVLRADVTVESAGQVEAQEIIPRGEIVPGGGIVLAGGVRTWPGGALAPSCEQYIRPTDGVHVYTGETGSGLYRIQLGAQALDVWCDMLTDSGGWLDLVKTYHQPGAPVSTLNTLFWSTDLPTVIAPATNTGATQGVLVRWTAGHTRHDAAVYSLATDRGFTAVKLLWTLQGSSDSNRCGGPNWVPLNGPGFDGLHNGYLAPCPSGRVCIQGRPQNGLDAPVSGAYTDNSLAANELLTWSGSPYGDTASGCTLSSEIPSTNPALWVPSMLLR